MSEEGLPALPAGMTLPALQAYVRAVVEARNFTGDLNKVFILLVEEVGELATEFKHRTYYPDRYDPANLSYEIIDILLYLLDLANGFGVELMELWPEHERANDLRFADRRQGRSVGAKVRAELTLNELAHHAERKRLERAFEDTEEMLVLLLCEEVGELAHEVRKTWKGRGEARKAGCEIIDALHYLFRIGGRLGMDFEAALAEKERENAARTWAD
jgi:NTP pyrophosphatase (non-canonical NTP hydrolase)